MLLALLGAAAAAWAFVLLAGWVRAGDTRALDRALLLALRTPGDTADPLGPAWFESFMRDLSALGSLGVLALLVVAVAGFVALAGRRRTALYVLASCSGGELLNHGLKQLFERPRPDLVPHGAHVMTASFPSGHALLSAVVYLTLAALLARLLPARRLRAWVMACAVTLTLAVGVSRVYLGVHWPSDVLAGWALGAAWALGWWALAQTLRPRTARAGQAHDA